MSQAIASALELVPEAVAVLDAKTGKILRGNKRFCRSICNVAASDSLPFVENFIGTEDRERFEVAIGRAREVAGKEPDSSSAATAESDMDDWLATPVVRDCDTLAAGSTKGFPVWRRYDWMLRMVPGEEEVLVSGRMTTVVSEIKKESELELMDFLNKAPIAMHWLSGTGHVLWANQTELNVLGYTAEEYIGQPIMKFCPDEEKLVLEIFKTLGSGNTIADVPVRFRTKDGKIKDLLIDSNVNWNADGSFKHTRCFIRDDTQRKIREARLEEQARKDSEIAEAKDIFVRKTFHELLTPCHLLKSLLSGHMDCDSERQRQSYMRDISNQVYRLNRLVDDSVDASLFDMGKVPVLQREIFCVVDVLNDTCKMVAEMSALKPKVEYLIKYATDEVASKWDTGLVVDAEVHTWFAGDGKKLGRCIEHLLDNAIKFTMAGNVTLTLNVMDGEAGEDSLVIITVSDTGKGMSPQQVQNAFSKYWQDISSIVEHQADAHSVMSSGSKTGSVDVNSPASSFAQSFDSFQSKKGSFQKDKSNSMGTSFTTGGQSFETSTDYDILSQNETFKEVTGLGVGLNVINNIVQCMGGNVDFTSKVGETVFCLAIPFPPVDKPVEPSMYEGFRKLDMRKNMPYQPENVMHWLDAQDSPVAMKHVENSRKDKAKTEEPPPPVGLQAMTLSRPHVLIVDDNLICQKVARSLVMKLGCTADVASHGLEAFEMVKSNPHIYDLIFMDLRMPLCDGIQATKMIRQDLGLTSLPIVAFTAEVGHEVREQCMNDGFDGFISKPAGKASIFAEIDRLVINKCPDQCPMAVY
jgi:PAS domain S-box-containing protein